MSFNFSCSFVSCPLLEGACYIVTIGPQPGDCSSAKFLSMVPLSQPRASKRRRVLTGPTLTLWSVILKTAWPKPPTVSHVVLVTRVLSRFTLGLYEKSWSLLSSYLRLPVLANYPYTQWTCTVFHLCKYVCVDCCIRQAWCAMAYENFSKISSQPAIWLDSSFCRNIVYAAKYYWPNRFGGLRISGTVLQ